MKTQTLLILVYSFILSITTLLSYDKYHMCASIFNSGEENQKMLHKDLLEFHSRDIPLSEKLLVYRQYSS